MLLLMVTSLMHHSTPIPTAQTHFLRPFQHIVSSPQGVNYKFQHMMATTVRMESVCLGKPHFSLV